MASLAFAQQQPHNPYKAPLYWSPYEYHITRPDNFENYITEKAWKDNIDWVNANLKQFGYNIVCIDGWGDDNKYNEHGYRTTHSSKWKNDYAYWAKYLQDRGMNLGMYNNPLWVIQSAADAGIKVKGTNILLKDIIDPNEDALWFKWVQVDRPGAEEYVKGYVQYYADMGIKYFRVDFLSWFEDGFDKNLGRVGPERPRAYYETALKWMKEACDANGMFLSLVMPHLKNDAQLELKYGHMIRINEDVGEGKWHRFNNFERGIHHTWWSQWYNTFDGYTYWTKVSGRNKMILDGDFIRINTMANDEEKKTVISLHLMAGGPLSIADQHNTIGSNLWLYQNTEMLALNQDGFVGKPVYTNDPTKENSQIWAGQMSNGDWIVGLFNREDNARTRSINFSDLGISGSRAVRDLWLKEDLGSMSSFSATVPAHGCRILKLTSSSNQVSAPTFSPAEGTYTSAQSVSISTVTSGATIHYTTDGSTPTTSSPVYSSPINVATTTTIKAMAVKSGMTNSTVSSATYTILASSALPSPWVRADIGSVSPAGTASYSNGVFSNSGAGADIEGTADAFSYIYYQVSGDVTLTARVESIDNTDPWAKAGVMIRSTLNANSINAMVAVTPSNGVTFQRRTSTGGGTTASIASGVSVPVWLRIRRQGNTISAFRSSNGRNWTQVGTNQTISMGSTVYIGLPVTSHNNGTLCTATFSNVSVATSSGTVNYRLAHNEGFEKSEEIFISNSEDLSDDQEMHLAVYPNPADNLLNIRLTDEHSLVEINDLNGRIMFTERNKQQLVIDTSRFSEGIYFLKVLTGEGAFLTRKIVVKRE